MKRRRAKRNPSLIGGADLMGALAGFAASYALAELGGRGVLPIQLRGPLAAVPATVGGGIYAAREGADHPSLARGVAVGGVGFGLFSFFANKQAAASGAIASASQVQQGNALLAQAQAMNKAPTPVQQATVVTQGQTSDDLEIDDS